MRVFDDKAGEWVPATGKRAAELQALVDLDPPQAILEPIVGIPDEVACFVEGADGKWDRARPTAALQAKARTPDPSAVDGARRRAEFVDGVPDRLAAEVW